MSLIRFAKWWMFGLTLAFTGAGLLVISPAGSTDPAIKELGRISVSLGHKFTTPTQFKSATLSIDDARIRPVATKPSQFVGSDGQIITTQRIRRFLASVGSPLTQYSDEIVAAAVRYQVDPRVVVAISGVESTFGLYEFGHNAWGWGRATWATWPLAIDSYTRMMGNAYHSLRTGQFSAASRTYCPPCGDGWGVHALEIFSRI